MSCSKTRIYNYLLFLLCLKYGEGSKCEDSKLCVPIKNCLSINQKLYNNNLSENDINNLKQLQCGYKNGTVYVCCKSSLPKAPVCGPIITTSRITGGNTTHMTDYPWTVLIGTLVGGSDGKIEYGCGGSLINNQYVLTAAHCIKIMSKINEGQVAHRKIRTVRLGEWDTAQHPIDIEIIDKLKNETIIGDPVIDMPIDKYIVHEKYHPLSKFYDIALIKLAEKVNYTRFIEPICLPHSNEVISNDLTIVGWGRTTAEYGSNSNVKQYAQIPIWNLKNCTEIYKRRQNLDINSTQLCAGGIDGVDSCGGDSGGPLIDLHVDDSANIYYYLAGIVSFGPTDCGRGNLPGVYTDVKSYLNWIYENIEHSGSEE